MENNNEDIRWIQRYDSFKKALKKILEVVEESGKKPKDLSDLEKEGLVQRFEYTTELAWKVLQDLLKYKGYNEISGPNPVLQVSFQDGLITNHDDWRKLLRARNTTSHTYNEGDAEEIVEQIYNKYTALFKELDERLKEEKLNEI
jgi:nucleotidyltransferase substrate binding protein (TIGR01987 family)